jgi:hypothetical protein
MDRLMFDSTPLAQQKVTLGSGDLVVPNNTQRSNASTARDTAVPGTNGNQSFDPLCNVAPGQKPPSFNFNDMQAQLQNNTAIRANNTGADTMARNVMFDPTPISEQKVS